MIHREVRVLAIILLRIVFVALSSSAMLVSIARCDCSSAVTSVASIDPLLPSNSARLRLRAPDAGGDAGDDVGDVPPFAESAAFTSSFASVETTPFPASPASALSALLTTFTSLYSSASLTTLGGAGAGGAATSGGATFPYSMAAYLCTSDL